MPVQNGTIYGNLKRNDIWIFLIIFTISQSEKKKKGLTGTGWKTTNASNTYKHTNSDRFYAAILLIYFIGVSFIAKLLEVDSRMVVWIFGMHYIQVYYRFDSVPRKLLLTHTHIHT